MVFAENFEPQEKKEKDAQHTESKEKLDKDDMAKQAMELHKHLVGRYDDGMYNYENKQTREIFEVKIKGNDIVLGVTHIGEKKVLFTSKVDNIGHFNISIPGAGTARYNPETHEYTGTEGGIKQVQEYLNRCQRYLQGSKENMDKSIAEREFDDKLDKVYR